MNKEFGIDEVNIVLKKIAGKNNFFVSERHLQTEFIIAASKEFPDFQYYPELVPIKIPKEYTSKFGDNGIHFDLLIKTNTQQVLVEFKYITHKYEDYAYGMKIQVKSHAALDIRRYDSWKDIERIETFVLSNESKIDYGYFILITNVNSLSKELNNDTFDKEFHINEGMHFKGIRKWKDGAFKGTIKGRNLEIETKQDYFFKYTDFYNSGKPKGNFKSLVVSIDKK